MWGEIMVKKKTEKVETKEEKVETNPIDVDFKVIEKALKSCYDYFLVSNNLNKMIFITEIEKAMAELKKLER